MPFGGRARDDHAADESHDRQATRGRTKRIVAGLLMFFPLFVLLNEGYGLISEPWGWPSSACRSPCSAGGSGGRSRRGVSCSLGGLSLDNVGEVGMKLIDHGIGPIFVEDGQVADKLILRIGEPKRGEMRFAMLSPSEARIVAYALLAGAERKAVGEKIAEPRC